MGTVTITIKDREHMGVTGVVFAAKREGEPGPAHLLGEIIMDGLHDMVRSQEAKGAAKVVMSRGPVSGGTPEDAAAKADAMFDKAAGEVAEIRQATENN